MLDEHVLGEVDEHVEADVERLVLLPLHEPAPLVLLLRGALELLDAPLVQL
jgi:hypothetical protein